jgi:beta-galactosidase
MSGQYWAPVRVNPVLVHPAERRLSLGGPWQFRLDPDERGLAEHWFADPGLFYETISVPGSWQGQGFGGDESETVWDFQLRARTLRATYRGTGWYGRMFRLPAEWEGERVWACFGGTFPSAEVWLNGHRLGEHHAPFVPFTLEISDALDLQGENWLVVRIHEAERDLGLAFSWQGCWSGLYRTVELVATGTHALAHLWVRPLDVLSPQPRLQVHAAIQSVDSADDAWPPSQPLTLQVTASAIGHETETHCAEVEVASPEVMLEIPIASPRLWSPDSPNLYRVDAVLRCGERVLDALSERVGLVELRMQGKHFLINGEPYYMRGSGDFIANPETGCPDADRERWRRKLRTLRQYGYNYVRCQSYVPTPEYFDAADEMGLLVQSEMGMLGGWSGHSAWHVYQWPQPMPDNRARIKRQWDQVVMRDINHPSANIYCMSNELGAQTNHPRIAWQCDRDTKALKPSALVIWTDGGYNPDLPGDFVNAEAELDAQCAKPLIQHEFRWWSSFPDVRLIPKYAGAVRPYGAEIALAAAARHGISHVLPQAASNSQYLQFLEAKGKMEGCRRDNPRLAGICHFNAMDANPSPQGIIDEFYERKVADASTWLQTNGDTVILSSLSFDDRNLAGGDTLRCQFSVSDFSHPPLQRPELSWELVVGEDILASGRLSYAHEPYVTCPIGAIEVTIPHLASPGKATLQTTLVDVASRSSGPRTFSNGWDFWLFPRDAALPPGLRLYGAGEYTWLKGMPGLPVVSPTDLAGLSRGQVVLSERFDEALVAYLHAGGHVLLVATEGLLRPFKPKFGFTLGHYFFTPPANYPPYEDGHDGTLIAASPMLGALPHESFADLQFFRLMTNAAPLALEPLGLNIADPVIRVMHSYPVGHSLAYLAEFRVGQGGLIVSALNLDPSFVEARYLLAQLCAYASAGDFSAVPDLPQTAVGELIAGAAI